MSSFLIDNLLLDLKFGWSFYKNCTFYSKNNNNTGFDRLREFPLNFFMEEPELLVDSSELLEDAFDFGYQFSLI